MDPNTELLLNITKQLGGLSADMGTVKESLQSFKDEMAQLKKDIRDHEGIHVELAPKKDIDAVWEHIRKQDGRINELTNKDANKALKDQENMRNQMISIIVGIVGVAGVGFFLYGIAENIMRNMPR